ncbi:MAG TPA: NUDIX domain-containing protein [Kofleriaceae bacterium]|nr:NUDIX domain-containing protein [Kofleriaceae bacterium]
MPLVRDSFCSFCGTKYEAPLSYPRTCSGCKTQIWANPIPVCVVLVQVEEAGRTGLLVVRRAIPPAIGKLALVGGFLEEHESWQHGGAREVREETGVLVEPAHLEPMWYASSEPRPNRVLLFSIAPPLPVGALPQFAAGVEASERGLIFGPGGVEDVFAFSTHIEAAKRYFAQRGISGPHDFAAR